MNEAGLGKAYGIKVKVYGADTISGIEERVHAWIRENPNSTVLDIKFSYGLSYRVMIIYR